jgi:hypothetical protein
MSKWAVYCNGTKFAAFGNKLQADGYADMQRSKIKGAGLSPKPLTGDEAIRIGAYAARQKWEVRKV